MLLLNPDELWLLGAYHEIRQLYLRYTKGEGPRIDIRAFLTHLLYYLVWLHDSLYKPTDHDENHSAVLVQMSLSVGAKIYGVSKLFYDPAMC